MNSEYNLYDCITIMIKKNICDSIIITTMLQSSMLTTTPQGL